MSDTKLLYSVQVSVKGIMKGKRKEVVHLLDVADILRTDFDGRAPECFNELERKACEVIADRMKTFHNAASLIIYKVKEESLDGVMFRETQFPAHARQLLDLSWRMVGE